MNSAEEIKRKQLVENEVIEDAKCCLRCAYGGKFYDCDDDMCDFHKVKVWPSEVCPNFIEI